MGHYYTGNNIAAAEKTRFAKQMIKIILQSSVLWPARSLNLVCETAVGSEYQVRSFIVVL